LDDPQILGVDAMKGSELIYPVLLKTKANQQWAAMRETRRRIRIALEENDMLPGDPGRVFLHQALDKMMGKPPVASHQETEHGATKEQSKDINPFTGEGM
jgi:small conductance mechanosensitive channel